MPQPSDKEISDAVDKAKREMIDELGFLFEDKNKTAGKLAYIDMEWHTVLYPDGSVGYETYHIDYLDKDYSIGNH